MQIKKLAPVALLAGMGVAFAATAFPDGGSAASARPVFAPSTRHLVYGFVAVGNTSDPQTVTISNAGTGPEIFGTVAVVGTNPKDFSITSDGCGGHTIAPGEQCAVSAVFRPTATGTRIASIRLDDNTPCQNFIQLAGSAVAATRVAAHAASCSSVETETVTSTTATTVTTTGPTKTVTTGGQTKTVTTGGQTKTVTTSGPTKTVTTAGPPPKVNSAPSKRAIRLPKKCSSRRAFTVHFRPPAGHRFAKVSVRINGRAFKVIRGKRIAALVNLRGLPRGRFTLLIDATLLPHGHYVRTRHYVTCVSDRHG